jgi:RHS repeat-associated protein
LRERVEYGDSGTPTQPAADRGGNRDVNRLGKLFRYFDEAGLVTFDCYDFKGNVLEKTRRTVSDAALLSVFSPPSPAWKVEAFRVNWDTPATTPLDPQTYTTTVSYDALNRVKLMTYPADVENRRRKLKPHYNRAGALESITLEEDASGGGVDSTTYVERIAYNAKGQRVLIAYGNGIMTRYAYDPQTFRLLRLRTERFSKPANLIYRRAGQALQDLGYEYDPVGNIGGIHDRTPGSGIVNSVAGLDALDRTFTYDAIYRLRSATGRECDKAPQVPWEDVPRPTDLTKTRRYSEHYRYDLAGNVTELTHLASGASFTRDFEVGAGNNRLSTLTIDAADFGYLYDANGNITEETTSRHFEWDWADRMKVFRIQTNGSAPSVHAQYLYDANGQRVKKLIRKQGGHVEVTVYIDGSFEYQRIVRPGTVEHNNTLHVMDNRSRVALVRVGQPFADDTTPAVKYHLGDHLGSSNLVVDDAGGVVSREEYTPYGETSFGSFARKRYRFSGKERDEESALNYHGARYYAPWLIRWISCDPAGFRDGANVYLFVGANPLKLVDRTGNDGTPPADGDAGAPLQQPTPDFVDPGGQAIFVMTDEERRAQKAELPEGGALPPALASKGLVPTTGGKEVKKYIEQEKTTGFKAAARNNPVVASAVVIVAVAVSPVDKKKGQKIADSLTGPEPKSEVAQGAEMYGGAALSLGETMLVGGVAGVRALKLRMPKPRGMSGTPGRPRAPRLTVSSLEVEEALKEAAAEAKTTLYHFGDLEGGVIPGKTLSTTPDPEYAQEFVRIHGGKLNRLEVPTARLKELEQAGAVEHLTDSIKGTTISGPEVRFKGSHMNESLAKELTQYKVP